MPDSSQKVVIAALYKFAAFPEFSELREPLLEKMQQHEVRGTLLLASEGINGTIAGSRAGVDAVLAFVRAIPQFADIDHKESFAGAMPFLRTKVRLKKEIVTLGKPEANPLETVGQYVSPGDWNALLNDPEVTLVDTRNDYEYEVGTFEGALNPNTADFREFPDWVERNLDPSKHKKVAMFCTGGIRCEKATSLLLNQGFKEVYHLQGGILKYLENVPEKQSKWQGECFVFDDRVSVDHSLQKGEWEICFGCKSPISKAERESPLYVEGIQCPHCHDTLTPEKRAALEERQKQIRLAKARGEAHIGDAAGRAYRPLSILRKQAKMQNSES